MLSDRTLPVGPVNLPLWLIGVAAALLVAAVLQRTVWRRSKPVWSITNDALVSATAAGIVVWKLTPLLTRFGEIAAAPARLIHYPGGTAGLVAGVLVAVAVALTSLARRRRAMDDEERPAIRRLLAHAAVPLVAAGGGYLALVLVPSPGSTLADLPAYDYLPGYEAQIDPSLPTVVTVWATWCGPCTAQMPEVDRFHERHRDEVNLVAVNLTATEGSLDAIRGYLDESSLGFPVALDVHGAVAAALEVRSTPTTVVFDERGIERARRVGAVNADWLSRRILPFGR
ncbi:MAG: TlpA family protein disulfide reductase [Spirochaetota bacterium]